MELTNEEIDSVDVHSSLPRDKMVELKRLAKLGLAFETGIKKARGTARNPVEVAKDRLVDNASKFAASGAIAKSQPTEFEIKVMRAINNEIDLPWGAAVGASIGFLKSMGYVDGNAIGGWRLTGKGINFLMTRPSSPEPCLHPNASFTGEKSYCPKCGVQTGGI